MNKQNEALKLALMAERVLKAWDDPQGMPALCEEMNALREALSEQPAQQPVSVTDELVNAYCEAWKQSFLADNAYHTVSVSPQDRKHIEAGLKAALAEQPASKPWMGLTIEELNEITWGKTVYEILELAEAKLREKNA